MELSAENLAISDFLLNPTENKRKEENHGEQLFSNKIFTPLIDV